MSLGPFLYEDDIQSESNFHEFTNETTHDGDNWSVRFGSAYYIFWTMWGKCEEHEVNYILSN